MHADNKCNTHMAASLKWKCSGELMFTYLKVNYP